MLRSVALDFITFEIHRCCQALGRGVIHSCISFPYLKISIRNRSVSSRRSTVKSFKSHEVSWSPWNPFRKESASKFICGVNWTFISLPSLLLFSWKAEQANTILAVLVERVFRPKVNRIRKGIKIVVGSFDKDIRVSSSPDVFKCI